MGPPSFIDAMTEAWSRLRKAGLPDDKIYDCLTPVMLVIEATATRTAAGSHQHPVQALAPVKDLRPERRSQGS